MTPKTTRNGGNLLVLAKIRDILDAFTLTRPEMTLTEIRDATGFPSSTVQRLVTNMVAQGFLDRNGDRIRIGMRMAFWAAPATRGIPALDLMTPILSSLRDATGESAALYISEGRFRVCVALEETYAALRREMHVGKIIPLHIGSAGHVLLAFQPELIEEVISDPLEKFTDETLTDPDQLRTKAKLARRNGFSISIGEREDGAAGLSAPVFNANMRLFGALSILGPESRMPLEKCQEWVDYLLEAAEKMTRVIGGRFPGESGN